MLFQMGQVILARHFKHTTFVRYTHQMLSCFVHCSSLNINLFVLFLTSITYLIDAGDAGLVLFISFFFLVLCQI